MVTSLFHLLLLLLLLVGHFKVSTPLRLCGPDLFLLFLLLHLARNTTGSLGGHQLLLVLPITLLFKQFPPPVLCPFLQDWYDVVDDLLVQSLFVGVPATSDRLQEVLIFVHGDSYALPFHTSKAIVFPGLWSISLCSVVSVDLSLIFLLCLIFAFGFRG